MAMSANAAACTVAPPKMGRCVHATWNEFRVDRHLVGIPSRKCSKNPVNAGVLTSLCWTSCSQSFAHQNLFISVEQYQMVR